MLADDDDEDEESDDEEMDLETLMKNQQRKPSHESSGSNKGSLL